MASHSFLLFLFLRPIQAGPVLAQQAFCLIMYNKLRKLENA